MDIARSCQDRRHAPTSCAVSPSHMPADSRRRARFASGAPGTYFATVAARGAHHVDPFIERGEEVPRHEARHEALGAKARERRARARQARAEGEGTAEDTDTDADAGDADRDG